MKTELERYKAKLAQAEEKVLILEAMVETHTRELYLRNQELEFKNKELEQFTYIASHDLQEPLRTVTTLADMVASQYADKLDEHAQTCFQFIREGNTRMRNLISALLDYGRLGTTKQKTQVDFNTVLADVLADLDASIQNAGAVVSVDPLPTLQAYETDVRLLFQNLISNAVKFRKADVPCRIRIQAAAAGPLWRFAVQDNGIGIDPQYKDKVFTIFQRLHSREAYEGVGIGLAHCKKIAALHEGTIWLESEPGAGTTFYVTLQA